MNSINEAQSITFPNSGGVYYTSNNLDELLNMIESIKFRKHFKCIKSANKLNNGCLYFATMFNRCTGTKHDGTIKNISEFLYGSISHDTKTAHILSRTGRNYTGATYKVKKSIRNNGRIYRINMASPTLNISDFNDDFTNMTRHELIDLILSLREELNSHFDSRKTV